jgi:hypothetical protein
MKKTFGVVLIRFPADVRRSLPEVVVTLVREFDDRLSKAFVVLEPGRARLSKT